MSSVPEIPVRDAATIVLVRRMADGPRVLMGQRGAKAVFMPDKFVFPGGAVDAADFGLSPMEPLDPVSRARLAEGSAEGLPEALAAAAIRELWEEAGLALGAPGRAPATPPADWRGFYATGLVPRSSALRFFFRAITPPGRPRRFDARFFLADAERLHGDPDDFSGACDELRHLQWVPLAEARHFPLPFVTELVLAEVAEMLEGGDLDARPVPFFAHGVNDRSGFRMIA